MADDSGGASAVLGLVLGGLLVFVVLAFALGMFPGGSQTTSVKIEAPKILQK